MRSNQKHIREIRFEGDTIIIQGEKKINQNGISYDFSKIDARIHHRKKHLRN